MQHEVQLFGKVDDLVVERDQGPVRLDRPAQIELLSLSDFEEQEVLGNLVDGEDFAQDTSAYETAVPATGIIFEDQTESVALQGLEHDDV